jgi:hypothetical protein
MGDHVQDHVFPLLGERTYLHGTTLFDAMLEFAPPGADLSFRIPHRIDSDRVRLVKRAWSHLDRSRASLRWTLGDDAGCVVAEPLAPSLTPARAEYAERRVVDALEIDPSAVTLRVGVGMSFVSTLIPMFKTLLQDGVRAHAGSAVGQWMFTRLDVRLPAPPFMPLTLRRDAVVPGRLARAVIEVAGQVVGDIYFSWVTAG